MDKNDVLYFLTKTKVENPLDIWHAISTYPQKAFYTVTEVKKPPDYIAYSLQQSDFIMTQSEFCKESFSRVTEKEKIHIVNFPFIGDIFSPIGEVASLKIDKYYNFKFFTIARVDIRKNLTAMMQAFKEEFAGDNDVCLIMKMGSDRYCIPKIFYQYDLPKNIYWMRSFIPDTSILYRSMNAYIATDCGEGWGAPTTEAMLSGIPTIAPRHSGHLDYMNDDNSFMVEVDDWSYIGFRKDNLYPDLLGPQLEWKVPTVESLKEQMWDCYQKFKGRTREAIVDDPMIKSGLEVNKIVNKEYVGAQLKQALDWYEGEYDVIEEIFLDRVLVRIF